jgi:hypothetical protein
LKGRYAARLTCQGEARGQHGTNEEGTPIIAWREMFKIRLEAMDGAFAVRLSSVLLYMIGSGRREFVVVNGSRFLKVSHDGEYAAAAAGPEATKLKISQRRGRSSPRIVK